MKTAIVTLPLNTNYGGILQNYALQQTLVRMGHEPHTLRFRPSAFYRLTHPLAVWLKQRGLMPYSHAYPLTAAEHRAIRANTDRFTGIHIRMTPPLSRREILRESFDGYIVGSDQVWRTPDGRYFLDFLAGVQGVKKVAYAASFGVGGWTYNAAQTESCGRLLRDFDAVSVREDSGARACAEHFGMDTARTLDPTMLLTPEDYLSLLPAGHSAARTGSAMVYILDRTPAKEKIVSDILSAHGLRENSVMPPCRPSRRTDIRDCVFPSVEEWLAGFAVADYVVTDSFHGTVFAILFNKPFVAISNEERGAARFHSLLRTFGLEDRLVDAADGIPEGLLDKPIDYARVNRVLEEERAGSMAFLENALK